MHMRALAKLSEKPGSNNARSPFYDHCFTFNDGVDAMVLLDLKRQVSQKHNCQCRFIQPLFVAISRYVHHFGTIQDCDAEAHVNCAMAFKKVIKRSQDFARENRCMVSDEYSFLWANSQQFCNWNG